MKHFAEPWCNFLAKFEDQLAGVQCSDAPNIPFTIRPNTEYSAKKHAEYRIIRPNITEYQIILSISAIKFVYIFNLYFLIFLFYFFIIFFSKSWFLGSLWRQKGLIFNIRLFGRIDKIFGRIPNSAKSAEYRPNTE